MTPAVFDQTTVDIEAKADSSYDFRVTGSVLKFDGFLKFEEEDKKAREAAKKEATQAEAAQAKKLAGEAVEGRRPMRTTRSAGLPELSDGEALRLEKADARAEVHAASAALQRSEPGEGAGGAGDRTAFDLCVHH